MLTKTQKTYLKSLCNTLKPLVTVGKGGISENVIMSLDECLTAHELVKISVLDTCADDFDELAFDLAAATEAEIINKIGRKVTVYRRNTKNPTIKLPR